MKRTIREYKALDRLVSRLTEAEWRKPVPRPETKERWTVKDSLAHITYWKERMGYAARGERRPSEERGLTTTQGNHLIYMRYRSRPPREVLAWHRKVQRDVIKALRAAPKEYFNRTSRGKDWPFDLDGHSTEHRLKDIEAALGKGKKSG